MGRLMISDLIGTGCFALALVHASLANAVARRVPPRLRPVLGEIEWVFPAWALVYLLVRVLVDGPVPTWAFVRDRSVHEPLLIFALMTACSVRPLARVVDRAIAAAARVLPLPRAQRGLAAALVGGPLLGSLITEPAAMTITAMNLKATWFTRPLSPRLRHDLLATLFVNVSVGGLLTSYAAAPMLMVADEWGWDAYYVLRHFGAPAVLSCVINVGLLLYLHRGELGRLRPAPGSAADRPFVDVHAALGTAAFLTGLIVLGPSQRWWIAPLLERLPTEALYAGSALLTAVVDNAALTYLAAQVPALGEIARRAVVAGAVVGGGLTLLANAPNAAGFAILKETFVDRTVSPLALLRAAIRPTLVAAVAFAFV